MSFTPMHSQLVKPGRSVSSRSLLLGLQQPEAVAQGCHTPKPAVGITPTSTAKESRIARLTSCESQASSQVGDPSLWSAGSHAGEPQCLSPAVSQRGAVRSVPSALSSICEEAAPPLGEGERNLYATRVLTGDQLQFLAEQKQQSANEVLSGLMRFQPVPACMINGVELNLRAKSLAPVGQIRFPGGKFGGAKRCRGEEDAFEVRCVQPRREHHQSQFPRGHGEAMPAPRACSCEGLTSFAIRAAEEEVLAALITTQLDAETQARAAKALACMELAPVPEAVTAARNSRNTHVHVEADALLDTSISQSPNFYSLEAGGPVSGGASCDAGFALGALFQGAEAASSPFSVDMAL